ncbi:MAG: alkaline shock response membrane anchor protein AmaP [Anaerolineae bacterium]|nr:alkaline shock response membrane anchor protein AmaP [Anaerolineae bacterium]NIQ78235.1 alkaline shock response membrane anchor protein AmaP [Anaerolineae bacterium]
MMNVFNRAMTILLFVVLMIVVPAILIFPDAMIAFLQQSLSLLWSGLNVLVRVVMVLAGIIFFIVCGLVLYLEFRRPARRRVKLERITGGDVELAVESIEQRLEYRVDQLPDVVSVSPKVKPRRKSIDVELNVETIPDVDVPLKTEEVCEVVREVVEGRIGLSLRKIKVNIEHAPYPELA